MPDTTSQTSPSPLTVLREQAAAALGVPLEHVEVGPGPVVRFHDYGHPGGFVALRPIDDE